MPDPYIDLPCMEPFSPRIASRYQLDSDHLFDIVQKLLDRNAGAGRTVCYRVRHAAKKQTLKLDATAAMSDPKRTKRSYFFRIHRITGGLRLINPTVDIVNIFISPCDCEGSS